MNENDYKNAFDKITLSAEKKNTVADEIILNKASELEKGRGFRPRGRQAAVLIASILGVYALIFTSIFMFAGKSELPGPADSSDIVSKPGSDNHSGISDPYTSAVPSEDNSGEVSSDEQTSEYSLDYQTSEDSTFSNDISDNESNDTSEEPQNYMTLQDMVSKYNNAPATYIITSAEQVRLLMFSSYLYSSSYGSFFEADLSLYDEEYFASGKYLILTYLSSPSGSYRYEVDPSIIMYSGLKAYGIIVRRITPTRMDLLKNAFLTEDVGFHCFITEINHSYFGHEVFYYYSEDSDYLNLWEMEHKSENSPELPGTYIITHRRQLEALMWGKPDYESWDGVGSYFEADLSVYNDAYFASGKYLILTYFSSSSGSFRYSVDTLASSDGADKLFLRITRISPTLDELKKGIAYTNDIGFHVFITEQSGGYPNKEIEYSYAELEANLTSLDLRTAARAAPAVYVVSSKRQLDALKIEAYGYMSSYGSYFDSDLSVYNDQYFNNGNYLLVTYFSSGSGSYRYEVEMDSYEPDSNQILFTVTRVYPTLKQLQDGMEVSWDVGYHCFITEVKGYKGQEIVYFCTQN